MAAAGCLVGIYLAVPARGCPAPSMTTRGTARELRNAVSRWRANREGEGCPSIEQLVQDCELDPASHTDDVWGRPFQIICTDDDVIVRSAGADGRWRTADDVVVPRGRREER